MEGNINTASDEIRPLVNSQTESDLPSNGRVNRESDGSKSASRRGSSSDSIRIRQPVHYRSINLNDEDTDGSHAVVSRYKYYSRLHPNGQHDFQMPDHIVPDIFYVVSIIPAKGKQSSIVTIFSLWNTMMGTSILSMPWAIEQAGFITGIALLVAMAGIMLYTSFRILSAVQGSGVTNSETLDFSDICGLYLGKWAQTLAVGSSLFTLLGGAIVYWILMSNFLYNVVTFIYHKTSSENSSVSITNITDYVCPGGGGSGQGGNQSDWFSTPDDGNHEHDSTFDRVWDEFKTVPLFLIILLAPLVNFKSPTFFTKFNSLGTLSVTYLVVFVTIQAIKDGIHLDLHALKDSVNYVPEFKSTFPALTGVAALAYFVQNCVMSIVRNQKKPENNIRDLIIAYILVAVTYLYMGIMFYVAYPYDKSCIQDNLLKNISDSSVLAFVARIFLFFQMTCVFPLLLYIFRVQLLHTLFGSIWPSVKHVLVLNACIIAVCVVFAMFLPHIGKIIGFVGSFCGLTYAIALPCTVFMKIESLQNRLTTRTIVIHAFLILLGVANFAGQFVMLA